MKNQANNAYSRRSFLGLCGGLAAGTAFHRASGANANGARIFQAGIGMADITPELGVSMAGHFHDRQATSVHDSLYARALVLDNGVSRLALVMVDNCLVERPIFEAARTRIAQTTGIAPDAVLMAATHTHTAPTAASIFQCDPVPGYGETMAAGIAEAVKSATDALEPAQIGRGIGQVPDEVFHRRWHMTEGSIPANPLGGTDDKVRMNPPRASEDLIEPAGPTDPSVPFIALRRPNGTPIAVLANYALHYVGGTEAGALSADYFGYFAGALNQLMRQDGEEAPFLAMMSNGASANINNINFREPAQRFSPYEKMQSVAENVAAEVYARYGELSFEDWVPLASATDEITLGVRKPDEEELARARAIVEAAEGPEMKSSEEVYARETLLLAEYPDAVAVPLQALRIGDIGIAAIPCEVFVEIGLALKAQSPLDVTFPIALANGYNGYLPTADQHALGGYETWRARSSYLEIDAADHIQETMLRLLHAIDA